MLYLAYLGKATKLAINDKVPKLLIVRKPMSGIPKGFIHVPQLSPSTELFNNSRRWKENHFHSDEKILFDEMKVSSQDKDAWWSLYVPAFERELDERSDMKSALQRLEERLSNGEDIYLFCYCKNVDRCHRLLVGNYFLRRGYRVDFGRLLTTPEHMPFQMSLFDEISGEQQI